MFNNTDSFSFLKWMKCGGQWLFLFQEMYSLVHMRVCPLLNSEGPCLSATCASWESSFKLFLTWQSSVYMADLDLSKSCLHWWCLDVTVCFLQWELLDLTLFCALETWVETWPASVLENSAPASECQSSDVWGPSWGGLLWVMCSSLSGFHGPPRGQCCSRFLVFPPAFHFPWGSWRLLRWATW